MEKTAVSQNQSKQAQGNSKSTPPRHWVDLQELSSQYWENEIEQKKRGQEFLHKPIETLEALERLDTKGVARREFLALMGASMAMATASCTRRPVNKIIPYVVKPEEVSPGVANYYASYASSVSGGVGVLVKTREGRPIKLEGNPDDPLHQGKLDVAGQAAVLDLYDPDRLKQPVKITRSQKGIFKKATWTEIDHDLAEKWKGIVRNNSSVRVLSPAITGVASHQILSEFLGAFRDADHIEMDPLTDSTFLEAQTESYGNSVVPEYAFDEADYVLSFGADFLGTWGDSIESTRKWARNRRLKSTQAASASMSRLVCVESHFSITGSNADERLRVSPGDELKVALALVSLITQNHSTSFSNRRDLNAVLKTYEPKKVVADIGSGITVAQLERIAAELWKHRGRGIVLPGDLSTQTKDSKALNIAVNLLNSILMNEGKTVVGTAAPRVQFAQNQRLKKLISDMKAGKVDVLLMVGTNPIYSLPESSGFQDAIKKVALVITIDDRVTESGWMSDYVLPEPHFLETWGDGEPRKGLYLIQQPVIRPLHQTRPFQESLLVWTREAKLRAKGLLSRLAYSGKSSWHDYIQTLWKEKFYSRYGRGKYFHEFWANTLQKGFIDGRSQKQVARPFRSNVLGELPKLKPKDPKAIQLVLYAKPSLRDGRSANNGWLQEVPHPVSTITWDNYLNMSPGLASRLGLKSNDVVKVTANSTSVEVPLHVQPGMDDQTVSLAVGYGRESVGKVGDGVGVNAYTLAQYDEASGQQVTAGIEVVVEKTGKRYELAVTQNHHRMENRPIINDMTLSEFKINPATERHTDPHLRLKTPSIWPKHKYTGPYRWGMVIDLNSCTGCSACVVACQAENNIPIVGRDRVRFAREMHWIRIDRYYSGSKENPDVVRQPMLCQHCENASCETVCPVLATVHNEEGMNDMAYNRCVGTRYCQNNCPYKVRRFNFFDHWKDYKSTQNLAWNPDVTVRSRGIMEKCTFCVQRIREKQQVAKKEKRLVRDGEIQTACQQTCPADAIVFGNVNDMESQVSRLKQELHAFYSLEILNNKPQIAYLSKVRNKANGKSLNQKERNQQYGHHS